MDSSERRQPEEISVVAVPNEAGEDSVTLDLQIDSSVAAEPIRKFNLPKVLINFARSPYQRLSILLPH